MRISRAPEHRGGGGSSPVLLLLVLIAVLAVGGVVAYLLLTQNQNAPGANPAAVNTPLPAQNPPAGANIGVNSPPQPAAPQVAAPTPALPAIPAAPNNAARAQAQGLCEPEPPQVSFGEALDAGFVDLRLLNSDVRAWYTLQVDTVTTSTTFFFAFFDPTGCSLSRAAIIRNYTRAQLIDNAEVTVYYPNSLERTINFDKADGTIISKQFYDSDALEPALFTSPIRISLSQQSLALADSLGRLSAEMSIDLTGLSNEESITISQQNPAVVERVLDELQTIVDSIESRRPRS